MPALCVKNCIPFLCGQIDQHILMYFDCRIVTIIFSADTSSSKFKICVKIQFHLSVRIPKGRIVIVE
jgi:hypothetical protein